MQYTVHIFENNKGMLTYSIAKNLHMNSSYMFTLSIFTKVRGFKVFVFLGLIVLVKLSLFHLWRYAHHWPILFCYSLVRHCTLLMMDGVLFKH